MYAHVKAFVGIPANYLRFLRSAARSAVTCALLLLMSAGCATVGLKNEVRVLQKAFTTVDEASQPLFDDMATAERRQGQDNAVTKARRGLYKGDCEGIAWAEPGFIEGFCLADAAYFSEIGDPPATSAFRLGIRIIGDYVEVLLILAEGRNLDATSAQVSSLSQNVAALTSLIPGAGSVGTALQGATVALDPVIRHAAQAKNTEELKRLIFDGAPCIKRLIASLRAAAPECFNTLVYQSIKGVTSPQGLSNLAVAEADLNRISAYRIVVSNYVVLLDELEKSFDDLAEACRHPSSATSLAFVAQRSAQLVTYAESWRKVYLILRTGGTQ